MRKLKTLLATLIIVWGLLALTTRAVTPLLNEHREDVAALLSRALGVPVAIDRVQARWYGLSPLIEFDGVRIGEEERGLTADRISLELSLGALLRGDLLEPLRVTLDGIQLTIVHETSGQLHLDGYGAIQGGQGRLALPQELQLVNTRVRWIDRKAGNPPLTIEDISVVIERDGNALALRASLATEAGNAVAAAQIDGFLGTTTWQGNAYLKVDRLDVARLFAPYLPPSYGLKTLELDLQSWTRWKDAALVSAHGQWRMRDLALQPRADDSRRLLIEQASAGFSVEQASGGLRVGLEDLVLVRDGWRWPAANLALALTRQADGGRHLKAAADYLRIEDVIAILQVRIPWKDLQEPLERLQPRGEVRNLALFVDLSNEDFAWRGRAEFADLGTKSWDQFPDTAHFSGQLHGQQDHIVLQLDSRAARLQFSSLRNHIELQELQGRLDWTRGGAGWQLASKNLLAVMPQIRTQTRLNLQHQAGEATFVDMQTDIADGDAASIRSYLPVTESPNKVVDWLDRAFPAGRITQGSALLYGPLDGFPFEQRKDGVFQAHLETEDLVLDYAPGWPPLERLSARVKFHGNQLDVEAKSAKIYDSDLTQTTAHIASLKPAGPLQVRGRIVGPLHDKIRVLNEKALRDRFGKFAAVMRAKGSSVLTLDFAIPLGKTGRLALNGKLDLNGASLTLPDWDFTVSDLKGQIGFDLQGLNAKGISGRTLNAPISVDVLPVGDGITRVRSVGQFAVTDIVGQLPGLPLNFADGAARFQFDLDLPSSEARPETPIVLAVDSDLGGIDIRLPPPLGKTAAQERSLSIRMPLGGTTAFGSLDYARQLSSKFSADGERVAVQLGGKAAELASKPGVHIDGRLPEIDVMAWSQALQSLPLNNADDARPITIDLRTDRLVVDTLVMTELHFNATRTEHQWQGAVEAPNMAGRFTAPSTLREQPIEIELERLKLSFPVGGEKFDLQPVPNASDGPDPTNLPGLMLDIADFRINDAQMGLLQLNAQRAPEGLRITKLSLRDGQVTLDSAGHWSRIGTGSQTALGGRISTQNLGDLVVDLGYSGEIKQAASDIGFLFRWPGSPAQAHRQTLDGKATFDIGAGRIVELDPGATRLVGLLNLNALLRRLRLDFRDLFSKGYSFDKITGDFALKGGNATTENLRIVGPSGRIDVVGSADLVRRTVDHHMTVIPRLDATLPIATTLAGGPVAGLAVLLAQTLMDKQVDDIYRFEYRVSGPLANPKTTQLDTGGTLSKLLRPFGGTDTVSPDESSAEETPAAAGKGSPEPAGASPALDTSEQ
ncbi:MAG: YhdP family protein [Sedimenticolaceae bacterium]